MRVGQRQRHRDLTVVLLAELPAVLPGDTDRVPPLLGKARVVDDPCLDRVVSLDLRQHHLAHFGQDVVVQPLALADEMQQRLMLGCDPRRSRQRRHRLDALALGGHDEAHAIVAQWSNPIGMADHTRQPVDIRCKPLVTGGCRAPSHRASSRRRSLNLRRYRSRNRCTMRSCDSVLVTQFL